MLACYNKASLMPTSRFLSRVGVPQLGALLLLLLFLIQCLWFIARVPVTSIEGSYIEDGLVQLDKLESASSEERSPLVPLLGALPVKLFANNIRFSQLSEYRLLVRLPFLFCGTMLGASLWYVARRLYGNIGGFIALSLYSFSPLMITRASQVQNDIVAAWGAFGLIFTAIAVAHTLYAPREVVLWNWRRIVLLGISIAICVGAQFSLWILLLVALGFLLWVGQLRQAAAIVIFLAACVIAIMFLWGLYGFHPVLFAHALGNANWFEFSSRQVSSKLIYQLIGQFFLQVGLGPLVLIVGCLVIFAVWKHTRFFGTAAPLISAAVLVLATLGAEHSSGVLFLFVSLPFLILFVSGVAVDLFETKYAVLANAVIVGALIANAILDVYGLMELRPFGVR